MVRPLQCVIVLLCAGAAFLLVATHFKDLPDTAVLTESSVDASRSGPQFIIFLGLEGTGHHWIQELFKASPSAAQLNSSGVTSSLLDLEHALFSSSGLLFLPCESQQKTITSKPCSHGHVECAFQRVVELLATIHNSAPNAINAIPLNGIQYTASYPQDRDYCRPLKYPSLDVLYAACRVAKVSCGHIYMHREPHAILESTVVKRRFNSGIMAAVVLYRTMLNVLYAQLTAHSNQTIACLNLLPGATSSFNPPLGILQNLFGWSSRSEVLSTLNQLYRPPLSLPEAKRSNLVDPKYKVYMQSLLESNEAVQQLCRDQSERRPSPSS